MANWDTNDMKEYTVRAHKAETLKITKMSTTDINTFKQTVTNSLASSGLTAFTSTSTLTSGATNVYYGSNGLGVYAYWNSTKTTCNTNTAKLTIYYVDTATVPKSNNVNCTLSTTSSTTYTCSCNLSKTGYRNCSVAYTADSTYVKISNTISTTC